MAVRHTARRLSAGAALVTGLGLVGIAAAGPANAAITNDFEYTCELTNEGLAKKFADPWKVNLSVDAPEQVEPSAEIPAPAISATVVPGEDAATQLRGLGVKTLEGTSTAGYTFGTEEREVDLTIDQVDVPASGDIETVAAGTGQAETAPAEDGEIDITAGDFTADLTTDTGFVLNVACAAPADATVGSITVGEGSGEAPGDGETPGDGEEPVEANDWFTEPDKLPITEDQKGFTIEGAAAQDGILEIALLDADKEVLRTEEWNVTEGDNTKTFSFAEGTHYVRIISQDCVDANGDDETVEGSGCNAEYYAPWSNPDEGNEGGSDDGGSDDEGSEEGDDMGAVDDAPTDDAPTDDAAADEGDEGSDEVVDEGEQGGAPEVPSVVQTDGFQPQGAPQQDTTLAIALGGLLLAGAGTGTVLVARRRAAASH